MKRIVTVSDEGFSAVSALISAASPEKMDRNANLTLLPTAF